MSEQMVFKRYEMKYRLTKAQKKLLLEYMKDYMISDEHGKNTTLSLYMDTPDFLLARRSMEHPDYKEKLRLRSYGVANRDSTVFIELKKKYDGIVYKRRASMKEEQMEQYIKEGVAPMDTQIMHELGFAIQRYEGLRPAILLCYDREAFYAKDDHEFRITFDENILWRDTDVNLTSGIYGERLIDKDTVLMEVKVANAIPLWLVRFLSGQHIYRCSFSKYAAAYRALTIHQWEMNECVQECEMCQQKNIVSVKNRNETIKNTQNGGFYKYA